ncbi:hypothetical protein [Bradyrhizobium cytisi]|uniref:Uncharacterized protein n=1 Tax=Bradyrhizobium cytisi TaxID=515489 RepID=A0A5S4X2W4_9BRAD|nr:hypothetical protein [Bradyrhizobium cytisi]TYL87426.1 hypothetical protein FXB38_04730 [Bradyrhizobium cytisi]
MPILQWRCAHGEAPAVTLACAETVELAPVDESVDSNVVHITGKGSIFSFGKAPPVLKRVLFEAGITLEHSPGLQLLCCVRRRITVPSIGLYASDGFGHWSEVHFTETGARELSRRLDKIEQRLDEIERRLEL